MYFAWISNELWYEWLSTIRKISEVLHYTSDPLITRPKIINLFISKSRCLGRESGMADMPQALTEGRGQQETVYSEGCTLGVHQMLFKWISLERESGVGGEGEREPEKRGEASYGKVINENTPTTS